MKRTLFIIMLAVVALSASAETHKVYVNASKKTNISKGIFHTVQEALRYVEKNNGKDTLWTEVFIAPSVYWLDNPDDPAMRLPEKGSGTPFAMQLKMNKVRLIGQAENAEDVVLAVNRGQTQGADGNYTMFHITGSDIEARNITFGNYCNVDLVYPRNTKLNRQKRKEAIVQAQIGLVKGDRYHMENCRFISRLNLCPFVGAPTTDYDNCYFESTDDALCGTGIYRHCRFLFCSSKPFYSTSGRGASFYDCDIHCLTQGTQYLMKASGPFVIENCRFTCDDPNLKIEWTKRPDPKNYCVMRGCTLNGKPLNVPTPTESLTWEIPAMPAQIQTAIIPGRWTLDCYKPSDTMNRDWTADNTRPSWGYAQGIDGAEGSWGMVQLQKGARMMYTPLHEDSVIKKQTVIVELDPCKGPGQGFGSATNQYLDICIKFNTRTLTGYGIRFIRTPEYDHSVETYLVEYTDGTITRISDPQRCDLFKRGCKVSLNADGETLSATVTNKNITGTITLTATMPHPNSFSGFHLQHTGSTGASATVVKSIVIK